MFWEAFVEKKKVSRDGKNFGLLYVDAVMACRISHWEGIMWHSAKNPDSTEFDHYQGRIRRIFLTESIPVPRELEMGYVPPVMGWPEVG